MTFSEFGRRAKQNGSNGTDHGTAEPMFIIGNKVKGGLYGTYPSLSDLDSNGDLKFSADFRSVYAGMLKRRGRRRSERRFVGGQLRPDRRAARMSARGVWPLALRWLLARCRSAVGAGRPSVSVNIVDDPRPQDRSGATRRRTRRVAPGTWVTWSNNGQDAHTVTAVDGSFDSGILDPSEGFSWYFDQDGTYAVHVHAAHVDDRRDHGRQRRGQRRATAPEPSPSRRLRRPSPLAASKRLIEVGDQVGRVFEAGREAHDVVVDAALARAARASGRDARRSRDRAPG